MSAYVSLPVQASPLSMAAKEVGDLAKPIAAWVKATFPQAAESCGPDVGQDLHCGPSHFPECTKMRSTKTVDTPQVSPLYPKLAFSKRPCGMQAPSASACDERLTQGRA